MQVLRRPPSHSEEGPTSSWHRSPAGQTLGVYLCMCVCVCVCGHVCMHMYVYACGYSVCVRGKLCIIRVKYSFS